MPDVTIQDVARAAGVSAASVSNLLNGRIDRMRADTRLRIETVISQMGYRPNPVARQLKTGRAPTLGLLVPTVVNPFYGELAAALEEFALARGYHVLLCNTLRDAGRESEFIDKLTGLGVRAVITGSSLCDPDIVSALVARGVSIVQFDVSLADVPPTGVDVVSIDNSAAAYLATSHLADLGHRSIAYVTAPVTTPNRVARVRGYLEAMRERGLGEGTILPSLDRFQESALNDLDHGELGRVAGKQLANLTPRPTAALALHDLVAIGVISGLSDGGLEVPRDVSVVGFNDVHLAALVSPALTTVRQPFRKMAQLAVTRLLERLADPGKPSSEHVFAPELIQRASVASLEAVRWPLGKVLSAP